MPFGICQFRLRGSFAPALVQICGLFCWSLHADENIGRFPAAEDAEVSEEAGSDQVEGEGDESIISATPPYAPAIEGIESPSAGFGWPERESRPSAKGLNLASPHALPELFAERFRPADPDAAHRYVGWGEPLIGTSWLNRPHYTAPMVGSMIADDLCSNAQLHNGLFASLHHGWDFNHFHGAECRLAGGSYDVFNSPTDSNAGIVFADASLMYYPWGDSRWRPYYSVGLGVAYHHVRDNAGTTHNETLIHFPLGIGVKYQLQYHCAMRFDIKHNINFGGGGLDAMDHVSLAFGFEYRYGGRPKSYFPWNPSIHIQ